MKKMLYLVLGCLFTIGSIQADINPDDTSVLLDDKAEIDHLLQHFPFEQYQVCHVKGLGYFFIDTIVDGIKNQLWNGIVWEKHNVKLLKKYVKEGTTVVDIGAYIGTDTIPMSKYVGKKGQVISFEPQKKIYCELVMNCILNETSNVTQYHYAIGNTHSIVQLCVPADSNVAGNGIGFGGEFVEMRTLDSFKLSNVSLIKIDVEGFEDNVLQGARKTILRNRPVILIEIMGGHIYKTASPEIRAKIDHTKSILERWGYKVTNIAGHDYLALPKS